MGQLLIDGIKLEPQPASVQWRTAIMGDVLDGTQELGAKCERFRLPPVFRQTQQLIMLAIAFVRPVQAIPFGPVKVRTTVIPEFLVQCGQHFHRSARSRREFSGHSQAVVPHV